MLNAQHWAEQQSSIHIERYASSEIHLESYPDLICHPSLLFIFHIVFLSVHLGLGRTWAPAGLPSQPVDNWARSIIKCWPYARHLFSLPNSHHRRSPLIMSRIKDLWSLVPTPQVLSFGSSSGQWGYMRKPAQLRGSVQEVSLNIYNKWTICKALILFEFFFPLDCFSR